jgi:hypothetical protein
MAESELFADKAVMVKHSMKMYLNILVNCGNGISSCVTSWNLVSGNG